MQKNVTAVTLISLCVVLFTSLLTLFMGVYQFENGIVDTLLQLFQTDTTWNETDWFVLMHLRIPRIVMALLVGCCLAVSGTSLQGMFKNPLASPDLIGMTSGAVLFAGITIVLGSYIKKYLPEMLYFSMVGILSFVGSLLSMLLVYGMAQTNKKTNIVLLLLSGVAISAICGATTGLLTYVSTDEELRNLTFWTLGSLGGANWTKNAILAVVTGVGLCILLPKGKALNAFLLGENDAKHLGIPVEKIKTQIIITTALMVGTCVAFCGTIGFIGLIVPYILRLLFKSNYLYILPLSAVLGSFIMVVADTVSRTVVAPSEIPIGILTAFMGAPVFILLLIRYKKGKI